MKKLRIGIIGNGGIAKWAHIPAYKNMDNVEIIAVCDILEERAKEASEMLGGKPAVFTDYKELLKAEGLDAVDICTPNYLHSIIAVDALHAGLHVFCEKPDAVSVEEALKMGQAAKETGKTLMVMRNNRFHTASQYLKKYIADGKAGEIYAGRCGWQRRRGIPGKGGWFTTKAQSGGGLAYDRPVHLADGQSPAGGGVGQHLLQVRERRRGSRFGQQQVWRRQGRWSVRRGRLGHGLHQVRQWRLPAD